MKLRKFRLILQGVVLMALLSWLGPSSWAQTFLVSTGAVWKYKDDGSDLGTSWVSPAYDDAGWAAGPAQLGYGDGDEATVVGFGPDAGNKYITTYFRRSFTVVNPSTWPLLGLRVLRDDGAVVYINGTEVFRSNMPGGSILHSTPAFSTVAGTDETTFVETNFPSSVLVTGGNVLAVEVHQVTGTSSDISFDLELTGLARPTIESQPADRVGVVGGTVEFDVTAHGPAPLTYQWRFNGSPLAGRTNQTLTLADVQFANAGGYSVLVGAISGSITSRVASLSVLSLPIVINEFMTDNISTIPDPADGDYEDWIELYNPNPSPVDLSGWHMTDLLADSSKWTVPNGTVIAAGGYLLVWADTETNQVGLHANFRLSNGGEDLGLSDRGGFFVDSFTYEPQFTDLSSGRAPNGTGPIRLLISATPGFANAPPFSEPITVSITDISGDTAKIVAHGEPGAPVVIQTSTDYFFWVDFTSGMLSNSDGTFEVVVATIGPARAYRARSEDGPVYSLNSVSYVRLTVPVGGALLANPLLAISNTVGTLLTAVPAGTRLGKWNVDAQAIVENAFLGTWTDPGMTLFPGQGFRIDNPTPDPFDIVFGGEVPEGTLINHLAAAYTLCSSIVPQSGPLQSVLEFPAADGDEVFLFNPLAQGFDSYIYIEGIGWIDESYELNEPVPAVGESFLCYKYFPQDWIRSFSVDGGGGGGIEVTHGGPVPPTNAVAFFTYSSDSFYGRVLDVDGTTPVSTDFHGQLYASLSSNEGTLMPVGASKFFSAGPPAGYINGGLVSIPGGTPGTTVYLQLRVWHPTAGNTYEGALAAGGKTGKSEVFAILMPQPGPGTLAPLANEFPSFHLISGPIINVQPAGVTVDEGGDAVFLVSASGQGTLIYQWYFNDTNAIPGATGAVLPVNDVSLAEVGNYRVAVSNALGWALSDNARLNVRFSGSSNLVWVPPGVFLMGSMANATACGVNESPRTEVTHSRGFWMGLREVTQGEYLAVRGINPSQFTGDLNRPVEQVTWHDALIYCAMLTAQERAAGRLPPGYTYRLPTEAEWEYVARAGMNTYWSFGDDAGQLGNYAWYILNSGCDSINDPTCAMTGTTHPVGTKLPNPWGFFDLHGNVGEWCYDYLGAYPGGTVADPLGLPSGTQRIFRGPAWDFGDTYSRSACRWGVTTAGAADNSIGFRVVLAPPPGESLVARSSEWKYLDDGTDQGMAWREPVFDDSTWDSGLAELGYGDGDEVTVVDYGPNQSNKYITTYFRQEFDVADPFLYSGLNLHLLRDDGAVVYLNGTEVFRSNMPSGPVNYRTLASIAIGGTEEQTFFETNVNPGYLRAGANVLAVEIHQGNVTSSDVSFDFELTGVRANGAPVITMQPTSMTVLAGANVTFLTAAIGDAPLSYHWHLDGVAVLGANSPTLVLNNVQPSQAGVYVLLVSNMFGIAASLEASLTVNVPPAITNQPLSRLALVGETVLLSVGATGDMPLSYQWRRHGVALAGQTNSTLTRSNIQIVDTGDYTVVVSNPYGTVTSGIATLTVVEGPVITLQPLDRTVAPGTRVVFDVRARGTPPLSFQWKFNGFDLPGATLPTLTLPSAQFGNAGSYAALVMNPYGSVTSRVALLTVLQAPQITFLSDDTSVSPGQFAQLCVTVSGPDLRYQWRKNGVNLPGQTNNCISLFNVTVADSGSYTVVIQNAAGAALSDPVLLTVQAPIRPPGDDFEQRVELPMTTNGPVSGTNLGATFQVGEPPHAGQPAERSVWYTWTAPISGIARFTTAGSGFDTRLAIYTGSNLLELILVDEDDDSAGFFGSATEFNVEEGHSYEIAIDGFAGDTGDFVLDWGVEPTDDLLPVITSQPENISVLPNGVAQFMVGASGTILGYQWYFEETQLQTQTNAQLTIANVQISDVGAYRVQVFGLAGRFVESLEAELQIWTQAGVRSVDKVAGSIARGVGSGAGDAPPRRPGEQGPGTGTGGDGSTSNPLLVGAGAIGGYGVTSTRRSVGQRDESICGQITGASQWLFVQALEDGFMQVDTVGSGFDTLLAVYTNLIQGILITDREEVTCDDNGADGLHSRVVFEVKSGYQYWVAMDGVDGASGTFVLNWAFANVPAARSEPSRYLVQKGRDAILTAGSDLGDPPPGIQWLWNDTELGPETDELLVLSKVGEAQEGTYQVVLSNFAGRTTNMVARLTVAGTVDLGLVAEFVKGKLQFNVLGTVDHPVVIEGTFDFSNWTPLYTNEVPNQSFIFRDTNSSVLPGRFYHAVPWSPP